MKIDWKEYDARGHVISWFLLEVISQAGIDKFIDNGDFDSSKIDVVLTVNGVDVDFVQTMNFLNSQLEQIEKDGYKNGVRDTKQDIVEKISNFVFDVYDK